MDNFILKSFFSLDTFYDHFPVLNYLAINRYQLLTVVWNIFLASMPWAFFFGLRALWRRTGLVKFRQKILAAVLFLFWLLFFPNSAYIITDVRHLLNFCPADSPNQICVANAWMVAFFFFYACVGWVLFYYLLVKMSGLVEKILGVLWRNVFILLSIPLVSLGVLLGLLNRFNSWDIFLFPGLFFQAAWRYFSSPSYYMDWAIFSVFLYLLYLAGNAIFREIKH